MERRNFLLSLCGGGAAAATLNSGSALSATGANRSRIVNRTNQTICMKIVGAFPEEYSYPDRGGFLFPEEEYFAGLGTGKRIVIAWNHSGEEILTVKEINVPGPSLIEVYKGNVVVTTEM